MDKIKVLQCSIANTGGGVTQYILNNWEKIDHKIFQFDFITFSSELDMKKELERQGSRVFFVRNRAEDNVKGFEDEIREILKNKYDVIHLHTSYWKTLHLERLAREARIPKIIIHAHNTAVFDNDNREAKIRQHEEIKKVINDGIATDYWACSLTAAEFLYGNKIPHNKIKIMSNAIDVNRFKFDLHTREYIRNKYGWNDKFVIGHVGRFSYQKNHQFLLNVIKEIYCHIPNLQVVLIGKGELENEIKKQIKKLGLSDIIYLAGIVDDVECWYSAMDLFLLPSRFEGLPIVLVESQTNGLKCVISNTITQEIQLSDLIYPVELSVDAWKEMIIGLYKSGDVLNNREIYYENMKNSAFDIDKEITKLEKEYLSLY